MFNQIIQNIQITPSIQTTPIIQSIPIFQSIPITPSIPTYQLTTSASAGWRTFRPLSCKRQFSVAQKTGVARSNPSLFRRKINSHPKD